MPLQVIKRNSSVEDFDQDKIARVVTAAGLKPSEGLDLAIRISQWAQNLGKPQITTYAIREKIIEELRKVNPTVTQFYSQYEKQKDARAHDFNLPATDGQNYFLESFKGAKGLVVVFTCNHCPYAKAAWPLFIKLAQDFKDKGVAFVGINPNDDNQYPEDSFEMMKQKVDEWQINFPYLRDESQEVAKDYGAVCTPDVFVYDQNRKLYYHGRINDNWQEPEKVTREELKDALMSLLTGNPPPQTQSPSIGCSIKWKN